MKFCTKCGEVYPSDVKSCNVDGAALEVWTRTFFEAKDDPEPIEAADPDADDDAEVTNVEAMPYDGPVDMAGQKDLSSTMDGDAGASTAVVDIRDPVTLTEFDVHSDVRAIDPGDELVCYDDEVGGPFQGMLISNRYRLETRIGTGGFGVVFDAYDKEENKRVAIKVLSPAVSEDKRALLRFRREAIAISRLQHPGIVSISDFGIEDEGVSYLVMEFLLGRDVSVLLEDERYLSARRAAILVMQCAEALGAAHLEGVLHRDLKPANIFVIQDDNLVERTKIIDFGIAKDRSSNPRMKDITAASKVVGTPFYMSPEQARGTELDGRADVYSLGVILYELLTGQRPFEGPSVYDILMAHGKAKRIKPSKVRPELRSEGKLDQIVLKAIAARREDRYGSMEAFAEALRQYLRDGAGGHASASSLRLDSSLEGIRPERRTNLASSSGQMTRRNIAGRLPIPLWSVLIPALAVAVGFGMIGASDSQGTSDGKDSINAVRASDVTAESEDADPATPSAAHRVTYTGVKDKNRPPPVDAGMPETLVEPLIEKRSSATSKRPPPRRAARARAKPAPKGKGIQEW